MAGFIDVGCITTYSYFEKFTFAFSLLPIMLGAILVVYIIRRKKYEGIKNRCIKMALTAIFLSYAFISQVRTPAQRPRSARAALIDHVWRLTWHAPPEDHVSRVCMQNS
jgi:hypothetical protein